MTPINAFPFGFAAVIYRNQLWGLIDNELAARGLRHRLRLALPHCLSVLHAVASSNLVACLQESVVEKFSKSLNLVLSRAARIAALRPADGVA